MSNILPKSLHARKTPQNILTNSRRKTGGTVEISWFSAEENHLRARDTHHGVPVPRFDANTLLIPSKKKK